MNAHHVQILNSKLAAKEEITALQEWNARLDTKLEKADSEVEKVTTWLDDRRKEKEAHAHEEKLHFSLESFQSPKWMHPCTQCCMGECVGDFVFNV